MSRRPRETRTRITLFLPAQTEDEVSALYDFLEYLSKEQGKPQSITGFTYSTAPDTVFSGAWWSKEHNKWVMNGIALFIIDHQIHIDAQEFEGVLTQLKDALVRSYRNNGVTQDEFWIVAQRAIRYV